MAEVSWTAPVAAVTAGLIGAVILVAIGRKTRGEAAAIEDGASLTRDLERRYDALIRRLAEEMEPGERASIEIEAAKVLRSIERIKDPSLAKSSAATKATARATPAWLGFVYGVATMAALGSLVYFASSGSSERKEGGSLTGGNNPLDMGAPPTSSAEDADLKALEDAVRRSPKEIGPRIELTRAYLHRRDLMKVFDQTKAVLEIEPGNPQALTYQALVRVAMGQAAMAEAMLGEALKKDPQIEDAYIHLALARIQQGNRKGAETAIREAQKRFPEDKEQLDNVFSQIASAAESDAQTTSPGPSKAAASPAEPAPSQSLTVVIDVPKGVTIPANAILFVIVREAGFASGPPVAVKRLAASGFPVTVTLTDKDSMAGESLPPLVRIDARVDRDGDPLSKDPRDPAASEDNVKVGSAQTLLVLSSIKP